MSVDQWRFAVLGVMAPPSLRLSMIKSGVGRMVGEIRSMHRRDGSERQRRPQVEDNRQHATDFPRYSYSPGLLAQRPEEVEEEGSAEDEGDEDTSKDVVRARPNVVIVMDLDSIRGLRLYLALALDVV